MGGLALRQGVMDVKCLALLRKIGKDNPAALILKLQGK